MPIHDGATRVIEPVIVHGVCCTPTTWTRDRAPRLRGSASPSPPPWRAILLGRAFGHIRRLLYGGYGRGLRHPPQAIRMSHHGGQGSRCDQGAAPNPEFLSPIQLALCSNLSPTSTRLEGEPTPYRTSGEDEGAGMGPPIAAASSDAAGWYVDSFSIRGGPVRRSLCSWLSRPRRPRCRSSSQLPRQIQYTGR